MSKRTVFLTVFLILSGLFSAKISASEPIEPEVSVSDSLKSPKAKEGKIDMTKLAFEHILDSHYWHFWGEGEGTVAVPLPCIVYSSTKGLQFFSSSIFEHGHEAYGDYVLEEPNIISNNPEEKIYDLSITKNVVQLLLSTALLLWIFTSIARAYKSTGVTSAPTGKQSFFEPLITFVRDDIAKTNIGSKSDKFVPYLLTVFFLILINNVLGMIPFGANLTGNIAFTLVLSLFTLILTNVNGNKNYWKHILLPPVPKALYIMMIPLEIIGIFTKPFALMIRLFANMTAGHMIVISLIGLIFMFETLLISPVSVAFTLFIDILECLVAILQAYIFTLLTSLFIGSACADHHEEGHEGEAHEAH
ncbi:MAG TPA: F0F1 ATP synthase subunit A [Bacteroidia bacterium]|jgi:F-type H+-transporting ATPase subunit a|nr:F0F1 ATP synthase subunit A [Bacteroidia bacterium]